MSAIAAFEQIPRPRVAIQGERGSFSDATALNRYGDYEMLGFETFEELFACVEETGAIGLCPVENSIRGEVPEARRLLAEYADRISVTGETLTEIHLVLAGLKGAVREGITVVHSHHVALDQCSGHTASLPAGAKKQIEADTAGSLDVIRELGDLKHGAVASKAAVAMRNGLVVLEEPFEDDQTNRTRFLELRRGTGFVVPGANKTSMIISHPDEYDALFAGAQIITDLRGNGVRSSRMHPVPRQGEPFDPAYFLDVEAAEDSHRGAELALALQNARARGASVTILGSYIKGPVIRP